MTSPTSPSPLSSHLHPAEWPSQEVWAPGAFRTTSRQLHPSQRSQLTQRTTQQTAQRALTNLHSTVPTPPPTARSVRSSTTSDACPLLATLSHSVEQEGASGSSAPASLWERRARQRASQEARPHSQESAPVATPLSLPSRSPYRQSEDEELLFSFDEECTGWWEAGSSTAPTESPGLSTERQLSVAPLGLLPHELPDFLCRDEEQTLLVQPETLQLLLEGEPIVPQSSWVVAMRALRTQSARGALEEAILQAHVGPWLFSALSITGPSRPREGGNPQLVEVDVSEPVAMLARQLTHWIARAGLLEDWLQDPSEGMRRGLTLGDLAERACTGVRRHLQKLQGQPRLEDRFQEQPALCRENWNRVEALVALFPASTPFNLAWLLEEPEQLVRLSIVATAHGLLYREIDWQDLYEHCALEATVETLADLLHPSGFEWLRQRGCSAQGALTRLIQSPLIVLEHSGISLAALEKCSPSVARFALCYPWELWSLANTFPQLGSQLHLLSDRKMRKLIDHAWTFSGQIHAGENDLLRQTVNLGERFYRRGAEPQLAMGKLSPQDRCTPDSTQAQLHRRTPSSPASDPSS